MITVVHHSADYDGLFCREVAKKFLPGATLIGWDFGDPIPKVSPNDILYLMDLSIDQLMQHPMLVWIDHHRTAIDKYPDITHGYRIDGVAACRLAYQYLTAMNMHAKVLPIKYAFDNRLVGIEPLALTLAGEYDVWNHGPSNGEDIDFQYGLDAHLGAGGDLADFLNPGGDNLAKEAVKNGKIARYCYDKRMADTARANCGTLKWEGITFLSLNSPERGSQSMASALWPQHEAMIRFNMRPDGQWVVSMYHAPGHEALDLSLIASRYGGGGHKGACGFQCSKLPWTTP